METVADRPLRGLNQAGLGVTGRGPPALSGVPCVRVGRLPRSPSAPRLEPGRRRCSFQAHRRARPTFQPGHHAPPARLRPHRREPLLTPATRHRRQGNRRSVFAVQRRSIARCAATRRGRAIVRCVRRHSCGRAVDSRREGVLPLKPCACRYRCRGCDSTGRVSDASLS